MRLDGGGCCNVMVISPDGSTVVGGSDTQGYYVTTNKAKSWTVQNTGIGLKPFYRQSASLLFSVTETSPQVIYSLTGEQGHGGGLLAGTLDGSGNITWAVRSAVPQGAANHCAAPLPTDGWKRSTGRLLYQDSLYLFAGTYNQGLMRSSNTGGGGAGGTAGRAGCTAEPNCYVSTGTKTLAQGKFDGATVANRAMAGSMQKLFFGPSGLGHPSADILNLAALGCRFWLCLQPAVNGADLSQLQSDLQFWLTQMPASQIKCCLYQEVQDHLTAANYLTCCNNYVPMIHSLGLTNVYCSAGHTGAAKWTSFYPINPGVSPGSAQDNLCDEVAIDMYGATWVSQGGAAGNVLQPAADMADAHGKLFGVPEMGSGVATAPVTITNSNFISYIGYVKNLMVTRLAAGKNSGDCAWYNGDNGQPVINTLAGPSTTIAAGSSGGKISNIATWSSPSAGVLKVASTAGFGNSGRSGQLWVQCDDHTVARINYHANVADGTTFGSAGTKVTYIDGSPNGTVSAGNFVAVWPFLDGVTTDFRIPYVQQFYDAVTVSPGAGLPGADGFPVTFQMNGASGAGWFCRAVCGDPNSSTTVYGAFYDTSGNPAGIYKSTNAHAATPNMTPLSGSPGTVEDLFVLGQYLYAACGNGGIQRYGPLNSSPAWQNLNGGTSVPNPAGTTTDWWSSVTGWVDGSANHVMVIGNSNATTGAQCLMRLTIPSTYPGSGSITYANETGSVTTATEPAGYTWWHAGGSYHNWLGGNGYFCPFVAVNSAALPPDLYCGGSEEGFRNLAGAGWQVANSGMPGFLGHPVAANPIRAGHLVYGSSDWCLFDDSASGAETAATLANDPPVSSTQGFACAISADGGTVYGSQGAKYRNSGGEVWSRPWNQPANWSHMNLNAPTAANGNAAIGMAAFNDNSVPPKQIVLAAVRASGMWRWNGTAWSNRSASILAADNSGTLMQVAYAGNGLCYAFDRGSGIWRSADYGLTWTLIWAKTSNDILSGTVAYDATRPGRLWVSAAGNLYQLGNADTGTVPGAITGAGTPVTCPGSGTAGPLGTDGNGTVFLASQDQGGGSGIWASTDDGTTWADASGGDGSFARCAANPEQISVGPFEPAAGAPKVYVSNGNVVAWGYPAGSAPAGVSAPFTEVQVNQNLLGTNGVLPMWFGAGGAGSTRGNLLIARVECTDGTAAITPSDPGWQLASDISAAASTSTTRVLTYWYPNNPGGIGGQGSAQVLRRPGRPAPVFPMASPRGTSILAGGPAPIRAAGLTQSPAVIAGTVVPAATATFTCSNPAATIKGKLAEYSSGTGTIQYLDQTGTASATVSATSLPVTAAAANTYTGGLAAAFFGAFWSVQPSGQGWTAPGGWTTDGTANNVSLSFAMYYQAGITAGPASVTGTITPGSGGTMTSWAASVATFYALAATPVSITTAPLPGGTAGIAYGPVTIGASGGAPPYAWAVTNGALPDGVLLDPATGILSGTVQASAPGYPFTYQFTVTVTDSATQTASAQFTITIAAALAITTASLPDGTVGQPYAQPVSAAGGSPPYLWQIVAGALPPGLALTSPFVQSVSDGTISGTPLAGGTYAFTVQATDTLAAAATAALSIHIPVTAPLVIETTALPPGRLGQPYSAQFTATGGNPPYTWALLSGSLPPGLTLNGNGTVAGTLLATGDFHFTVTVTDV